MLVVCSAVPFEAKPTLDMLVQRGVPHFFLEVGIGPLNAARRSALFPDLSDTHVLFLGSCGSFYEFRAPHLVAITQTLWLPTGERMGHAAALESLHPPIAIRQECSLLPNLPRKTALTSSGISLTPLISSSFTLEPEDLVENMEIYACLPVLQKARQVDVILGVTNGIGPRARYEWKKNFRTITQLTADAVEIALADFPQ